MAAPTPALRRAYAPALTQEELALLLSLADLGYHRVLAAVGAPTDPILELVQIRVAVGNLHLEGCQAWYSLRARLEDEGTTVFPEFVPLFRKEASDE